MEGHLPALSRSPSPGPLFQQLLLLSLDVCSTHPLPGTIAKMPGPWVGLDLPLGTGGT